MECSNCGGLVVWKGPITNLTHTECGNCAAINSQIIHDDHTQHPEEGDRCTQEECEGTMHYPPVENCTCHINPPCRSCTDNELVCDTCLEPAAGGES